MITELDEAGINMMIGFEGCVLHPYLDQVGIPTIGIGCTYYAGGKRVTMGDPDITQEQANAIFLDVSGTFADAVHDWTVPVLTQNQFNALFSFCYNIGTNGFKGSTVLKLVNQGITGQPLKDAFLMWDKAKGHIISDLYERRIKEYSIYMS